MLDSHQKQCKAFKEKYGKLFSALTELVNEATLENNSEEFNSIDVLTKVFRAKLAYMLLNPEAKTAHSDENMEIDTNFKDTKAEDIVKCCCGNVIAYNGSNASFEENQQVTLETSADSDEHKITCNTCENSFCSDCNVYPYHDGITCEAFMEKKKCRFCKCPLMRKMVNYCSKQQCIDMAK